MKRNRKNNIKLLALTLILLLGIGFAALAANLKIDGTLNVSRTSWDVHFENVNITTGSVTANPAPTSDNTTTTEMAYTINFTKPGDFFEFTTDIVNDGTIDAMVDVVSNNAYATAASTTPISLPSYLTNTVTYDDGVPIDQNQLLAHGTSEKIKVRVEFKKDISASDLPSSGDTSVVFKFNGDYKQADSNAEDRPLPKYWTIPEGKTATTLSVGDEICLKDDPTQCFNFLHYDGTNNEDVVMLSKWNLNVGSNAKDTATNKQDSDVKGYVSSGTKYGNVAFSATNYWYDGSALKPEYGSSYPADVYDPVNYKTEPDFSTTCDNSPKCYYTPGYSVAYYVEAYKDILSSYGTTIKDARLLTYSEATDSSIGCDGTSNYNCPTTGFITNTSFWLGSASYYRYVWFVYSDGEFRRTEFDSVDYYGVRPVVVISKSDI